MFRRKHPGRGTTPGPLKYFIAGTMRGLAVGTLLLCGRRLVRLRCLLCLSGCLLLELGRSLLREQQSMDVRQHTTMSNGHAGEELSQLFVIPDGQLNVPRDDPGLVVVTAGIPRQLEHLLAIWKTGSG